ncbi:MAG: hypothetical protein MI892_09080 [Desulfobacterales bacterium]|nr:hypothetical protein [Desulfobacterales bacterium]
MALAFDNQALLTGDEHLKQTRSRNGANRCVFSAVKRIKVRTGTTIFLCAVIVFMILFFGLPDTFAEEDKRTKTRPRYTFEKYYKWGSNIEARICRSNVTDHLIAQLYRKKEDGSYTKYIFSAVEARLRKDDPKPQDVSAPLNTIEAAGQSNWEPMDIKIALKLFLKRIIYKDRAFGGQGHRYWGIYTGFGRKMFRGNFYNPTRKCLKYTTQVIRIHDYDGRGDGKTTMRIRDKCLLDEDLNSYYSDYNDTNVVKPDVKVLLVAKITANPPAEVPYCNEVSPALESEENGPVLKKEVKTDQNKSTGGLTLTAKFKCSNGIWFTSKAERDACEKGVMMEKEQERIRAEEAEAERKRQEEEKKRQADIKRRERLAETDRACAEAIAKTGSPCHPVCSNRPEFAGCKAVSQ